MTQANAPHMHVIVTIDGPAGAGKSTIARELADRLGADFLDTGAMYRGVAAAAIDAGIDPADDQAVAQLVQTLGFAFDFSTRPPALQIDGRDVTDRLRDTDVTAAASEVAANPAVRRALVQAQRDIGRGHPKLVTEGRDQGSVVFPEATVKFYLDATPQVRACRRAQQLRGMGKPADEQQILADIRARDRRDATRRDGPLIQPDDAIVIDSTDMTLEQVVDAMQQRVKEKSIS